MLGVKDIAFINSALVFSLMHHHNAINNNLFLFNSFSLTHCRTLKFMELTLDAREPIKFACNFLILAAIILFGVECARSSCMHIRFERPVQD